MSLSYRKWLILWFHQVLYYLWLNGRWRLETVMYSMLSKYTLITTLKSIHLVESFHYTTVC